MDQLPGRRVPGRRLPRHEVVAQLGLQVNLADAGVGSAGSQVRVPLIRQLLIVPSGDVFFADDESAAGEAAASTLTLVMPCAELVRDGRPVALPASRLVPGDVVQLASALLRADAAYVRPGTPLQRCAGPSCGCGRWSCRCGRASAL